MFGIWTVVFAVIAGFVIGRLTSEHPDDRKARLKAERTQVRLAAASLTEPAKAELRALIADGKVIEAIKIARRDLNLDLKDAKGVVDNLRGA